MQGSQNCFPNRVREVLPPKPYVYLTACTPHRSSAGSRTSTGPARGEVVKRVRLIDGREWIL